MALVLAPISTASAQEETGTGQVLERLGWLSTIAFGGIITTVVGGVVLTVVLVASANSEMEAYMEQNAVAIQHDLYMGSGATARDLATAFHVSEQNFERFAGILFAQRHHLAPLAEPGQIDGVSAHQFTEIIVDSMLNDEILASHIRSIFG